MAVSRGVGELSPPRDGEAPPLEVAEWVAERVLPPPSTPPPAPEPLLVELGVGARGVSLPKPLRVAPEEVDAEGVKVGVAEVHALGATDAVGVGVWNPPVLDAELDTAKDTLPPPLGVEEEHKVEEGEAFPLALSPPPPRERVGRGDCVPSPLHVPLMDPDAVNVESSPVEDTHTEL